MNMERGASNPKAVAASVLLASVRPRLAVAGGDMPFQIWWFAHSPSHSKQVLSRIPEPAPISAFVDAAATVTSLLSPDAQPLSVPAAALSLLKRVLCRITEPEPTFDFEATAASVASLLSSAARPLSEPAAEWRARFRIGRSEAELTLHAEVAQQEGAILHALCAGINSNQDSSSLSIDMGPPLRSDILPFAAFSSWSYRRLRLMISPLPLAPWCKELGNLNDSSPMLIQNSSKNSSAPFQVQIAQFLGKTILQWVKSTDLVQNLKANLERRLGIPSALQRLLFQGKQLDDQFPLSLFTASKTTAL